MSTITLENPIKNGEKIIETIELRKPKAGEMIGIKNTELLQQDYGQFRTFLQRVTTPTITPELFDELSLADATHLMTVVSTFLVSKHLSVTM